MQTLPKIRTVAKGLAIVVAGMLALSASDDASAAKKRRAKHPAAPTIVRDYDGTPVIMRGLPPRPKLGVIPRDGEVDKPIVRPPGWPRGSTTYIPPPVPSPDSPNSPPSRVLLQPGPGVYQPPPVNSFSDRVRNCIHAAPFAAGVGNNPANPDAFVRSCAN
jgi:hypothetical protein